MKKRWFCLLLAALMALSLLPTGALAADPADLQYTIADGSVTITGCDGARGDLVIPSVIEGYPVRAIGAAAFDGCAYLTRAVIPEGVTSIGTRAFAGCERLEIVSLPTTLKSIGIGAFLTCVSLKSVTLPDGLKTLSPYAFSVCESLESITIPAGVTTIENEAFYGAGLKKVTIPDSVTTVETQAFSACKKLAEVELRSAATKLEDDAFSNCASLRHVFCAGTEAQWKAAGGEFAGLSDKAFLHYGVGDGSGHVQTIHFDPTAAHPGYDAWECACGYSQLTSDVVYLSEGGLKAAISERTDLRFSGAAFEPDTDAYETAVRSQSARKVLHFYRVSFSDTDTPVRLDRVVIELPAPEDVFPDSIRAYAIEKQADGTLKAGEVSMALSADQTTLTLTGYAPCEFCLAGNSNAHVHQLTAVPRVEPTCTEPGAEAYWKCAECGMLFADAEGSEEIGAPVVIPAKGHRFEARNARAATCTEPGYTGDQICKSCGEVLSVGEVIPALDHETELKNAKEATCTEPGYTGDQICKNCGKVVSKGEAIPMLDHETELKNAKDATCAAAGYTGDRICKNCGKVVSRGEIIPTLAHETELKNAREATCTRTGYTGDQICKNCGKVVSKGEAIPMLNHETELKNAKDPTCTRAGYAGDRICKHCGKVVSLGEEIPALGHKPELRGAVKADCTTPGYSGDEVCSVCGETLKKGEPIPAIGHRWGDWKVTKPATVEAEGVETRACTACGEVETRAIPKVIPPPSSPFVDVTEDDYFNEAVHWAVNHEPQITNGTGADLFSPKAVCTRGQVVTFLWRAMGCPEPKSTVSPFADVKPSDYFFKPVLWAVENGVTNGMDATHFDPEGACTRAHVVTFLWRAHGKPAAGTVNPFVDVKDGQYYTEAVLWAVSQGITNGMDETHFGPNEPCIRGQIVTFLWRDLGD